MLKRTGWILLGAALVGPVIGFAIACVVTYVTPKIYESEAIIELKLLGDPSAPVAMTSQFFGAEFEKIKSQESLGKVVDSLELVSKWSVGKDRAIGILKGMVNTENLRGTDLICIRVRHTNKEDARDIAAEVVRAYRDYRAGILRKENEIHLAELNKVVRAQEDKAAESRKALAAMVDSKNLLQSGLGGISDENKAILGAQDYIDKKRDLEADQALLQETQLKQVEAVVRSKMNRGPVVEIHDDPQISEFPISPNVPLNLTLGAALGFILSLLMAIPLIFLLNRLNPVEMGYPAR